MTIDGRRFELAHVLELEMRRGAILSAFEQIACRLKQQHHIVALVRASGIGFGDQLRQSGRQRVAMAATTQPIQLGELQRIAKQHRLDARNNCVQLKINSKKIIHKK